MVSYNPLESRHTLNGLMIQWEMKGLEKEWRGRGRGKGREREGDRYRNEKLTQRAVGERADDKIAIDAENSRT